MIMSHGHIERPDEATDVGFGGREPPNQQWFRHGDGHAQVDQLRHALGLGEPACEQGVLLLKNKLKS